MKTFLLLLLVVVNTFLYSQKIIPVKVIGYEKSNFKELKWFALVNYGDKVLKIKKPKIGKTLFYVDTVYGDVYNVWEYETNVFDSLFNINYIYHGDNDIMVTKVVKNKNNQNFDNSVYATAMAAMHYRNPLDQTVLSVAGLLEFGYNISSGELYHRCFKGIGWDGFGESLAPVKKYSTTQNGQFTWNVNNLQSLDFISEKFPDLMTRVYKPKNQ